MSRIIGISGLAGSGKDTAARILAERYDLVVVGLADPIKRACRAMFGWDYATMWGPSGNKDVMCSRTSIVPRVALQQLGTEFGRAVGGPNVWVNELIRTYSAVTIPATRETDGWEWNSYDRSHGVFACYANCEDEPDVPNGIVVPDVRFRNELEAIRARGGRVLRIVRKGAGLHGVTAGHASERDLSPVDCDYVVRNDGTLDELRVQLLGLDLSAVDKGGA